MTAANVRITAISPGYINSVVQVHFSAFPGYLNTQLGKTYIQEMVNWFCKSEERIALCAMDAAENVQGYVLGAPLGYTQQFNKDLRLTAIRSVLSHPWIIIRPHFWRALTARLQSNKGRSSPVKAEPDLPGLAYSLVSIGVDPEARGKGIGEALITEFEIHVRRLGAVGLRLSVYPSNASARRLYEKAGWAAYPFPAASGAIYYYKIISKPSISKPL